MTPSGPRVSVIVPCFNHGHFLADAIESVLGQTYGNIELIVVDDGSTDDTALVARAFGDKLRYVHQANRGLSGARNTGIQAASGDFLLFLDSDDCIETELIARVIQAATEHPDGHIFHAGWHYIGRSRELQNTVRATPIDGDAVESLLQGNRFPPCAVVIARNMVDRVGEFKDDLRAGEDWDYWTRAAILGAKFVAVSDVHGLYRRYPGTMSTDHQRMWHSGLRVLHDADEMTHGAKRLLVQEGVRSWRRYCGKRLVEGLQASHPVKSLRTMASAVATDPALAPVLAHRLASLVWHRSLGSRRR